MHLQEFRLAALLPSRAPGFASVCAYHSQVESGSKEAAEAWAHSKGLVVSHGICPECAKRIRAEMANAVVQSIIDSIKV